MKELLIGFVLGVFTAWLVVISLANSVEYSEPRIIYDKGI